MINKGERMVLIDQIASALAVALALVCNTAPSQAFMTTTRHLPTTGTYHPNPLPTRIRKNNQELQKMWVRSQGALSEEIPGVTAFEKWFECVDGARCSDDIKHNTFYDDSSLRGLAISGSNFDAKEKSALIEIPKSIVLQSDFDDPNWDRDLAIQLWQECKKGAASPLSGYCSLLTKDNTDFSNSTIPSDTAPDALRHWTNEEKESLFAHPVGMKLLDLEQRQESSWREKYSASSAATSLMTWPQFVWSMEAVHSRAFRGNFGPSSGPLTPVLGIILSALSAIGSLVYYFQVANGVEDMVFYGLVLLSAVPSASILLSEDSSSAVLLPLIDSANHLNTAESTIEFSPLTEKFSLTAKPSSCFVDEGSKRQLYISYGSKSDAELLLNYGFLAGMSSSALASATSSSERRKALAAEYIRRGT